MVSPLATRVVEGIAKTKGGLLWLDDQGMGWAVRVGRMPQWDPTSRYGFAISWAGSALLLDSQARLRCDPELAGQLPEPDPDDRDAGRARLRKIAGHMRLYHRAEQLLWMIHAAVFTQRSSIVLLPDLLLGQMIWGGQRNHWPQDWRGDIMQTLKSLAYLHTEILRLGEVGWQPRLGAHSVGLVHVEQLGMTRPREDFCRPCCPMYHDDRPHSHFLVQIGTAFLGVLEKFMDATDCTGKRTYDFGKELTEDAAEELTEYRKKVGTPSVNLPVKVFGPARWSGLSPGQRRIIQALTEEVTRAAKSQRPDKAFVLHGNYVPSATRKRRICCPFLDSAGSYVAFNGNGRNRSSAA